MRTNLKNTIATTRVEKKALYFVVLMGIISLFADMTYEGARSINGPFLAVLGANALTVGVVAGSGELIGYSLRLFSGRFADRTHQYWLITIVGYVINLLAVPLLAFTGHWQTAAVLMIVERIGKGIRVPPRDAMLSLACERLGSGFGFGLHETLDQIGAMLGPLLASAAFYLSHNYHTSYASLFFPALCALLVLVFARSIFPTPHQLTIKQVALPAAIKSDTFKIYLIASAFIACGYADFPLIAYHFEKSHVIPSATIPLAYAGAMGISGLAALILGPLYDRIGLITLIVVTFVASFFAPLVFFATGGFAIVGVVLWSIGVGAQESLMRAVITNQVPAHKRASAYGTFNLVYGIAWFIGSIAMGALYDYSLMAIVIFSLVAQLASLPLLFVVMRRH